MTNKTSWKYYTLSLVAMVLLNTCSKDNDSSRDTNDLQHEKADVAVQWADMSLYTVRFSSFNSPTYTSRSLGYLGLAMYECLVHGDSSHHSMSGQLNGLSLPAPGAGVQYNWVLVLNAGQDTLLKLLYPVPDNSHRFVHERIDSLYQAIVKSRSKDISKSIADRSIQFGQNIALAIYNWSKTDGGDRGFSRNFEPSVPFPQGPSYWVPPIRGQTISLYPLHPKWGNNRMFVPADNSIPVAAIVPYSTNPTSDYYKLYKAVYDKDKTLTLAERELAAWWGDDPTETFSPPGHSYFITTIAIKKSNADIMKAAEAYARTGMAIADAFIQCWKSKVTYYNERPSTFVRANIDANWIQFWPEPPFPAFPSGHSIQSAAAATVQADIFGDNFSFTDSSHAGFRRYDDTRFLDLRYPPRSFTSFMQAANECAYSRFLGGIHTQQDNDAGAAQGVVVGRHVNALHWKN